MPIKGAELDRNVAISALSQSACCRRMFVVRYSRSVRGRRAGPDVQHVQPVTTCGRPENNRAERSRYFLTCKLRRPWHRDPLRRYRTPHV